MKYPHYLIGAPLRREWSLPEYFKSFLDLDYPQEQLSYYFVINDAPDEVENQVRKFKTQTDSEVDYKIVNTGMVPDSRVPTVRKVIYEHLANMRNLLLEKFEGSGAEYFLSVDSDIYVKPHILVEFNKFPELPYLSAWISNHAADRTDTSVFSNCLNQIPNRAMTYKGHKFLWYNHIVKIPMSPVPFKVDVSGACFRISREVVELDVYPKFAFHPQGEDCAYCQALSMVGFPLHSIKNNLAFHDIR